MKREACLTGLVSLLVISALLSPALTASVATSGGVKIVSLRTDKDVYHLGEKMVITLSVYSPGDMDNIRIDVSGLRGRHGHNLIDISRRVNLSTGINSLNLSYRIPSCGCAVRYGNYILNVSVRYDGAIVNATHGIALTGQGKVTYVAIMIDEAKRLIETEDVTLLDVRTAEEYKEAHIRGAISIPLAELDNRTEELNKSKKIIVYCCSGLRSAKASDILIKHGFKRVYNMIGGITAWQEHGYPVTNNDVKAVTGISGLPVTIAALITTVYMLRRRRDGGDYTK